MSQFGIHFIHLTNFSLAKQTSFFNYVQHDDAQNKYFCLGEVGAYKSINGVLSGPACMHFRPYFIKGCYLFFSFLDFS